MNEVTSEGMSMYPGCDSDQHSSRDDVLFDFPADYLSQFADDSSFFQTTDWPYDLSGNYTHPISNEGFIQGHKELVRSETPMVIGEGSTSSREVIVQTPMVIDEGAPSSMEVIVDRGAYHMHPLDTYQVYQKSSSSKTSKGPRRKLEPFTIEEVKELVQAVDKLGTGRWQMIKDELFTYGGRTHTDLKDKWRNLVKTAKRPAHKRRSGAMIPEWLLEWVLSVDSQFQCSNSTNP